MKNKKTTLFNIKADANEYASALNALGEKEKKVKAVIEKIKNLSKDGFVRHMLTFSCVKPEDKIKNVKTLERTYRFACGISQDVDSVEIQDLARRTQGALFAAFNEGRQAGVYSGNFAGAKGALNAGLTVSIKGESLSGMAPIGLIMGIAKKMAIVDACEQIAEGKQATAIMKPVATNKTVDGEFIPGVFEYDGGFFRYDSELARKSLTCLGVEKAVEYKGDAIVEKLESLRLAMGAKKMGSSSPEMLAPPVAEVETKARRNRRNGAKKAA